jgi:CheY-like chemotaxis protein
MIKLLIVDDNEQGRYLLQSLLEGNGYEVITAENGAEALELARRNPPNLVISDVLMPVMDGFTLCRQWLADEALRNIPFVFYSATYTDRPDQELALKLGAARFLVKPVEPEVFVRMRREVLTQYQAGRLAAPDEPPTRETVYLREYNEALIRKLEDKMVQVEEANRRLEPHTQEIARQRDRLDLLHRLNVAINRAAVIDEVVAYLGQEMTQCAQLEDAGGR